MDLFVDAIDSKLLPYEKYQKLLKSKKKRKTNHGIQSNGKGENIKNEESNENEITKELSDDSSNGVGVSTNKTVGSEDETATPFLNSLIDNCTSLVRFCNSIHIEKQKQSINDKEFIEKVFGINNKCQSGIDNIKRIIKKLAPNHIYNDNTNPFEILFDEIEYGLKNHNRTKYPKLPSQLDASLKSDPSSNYDENRDMDIDKEDEEGDNNIDNKDKDNTDNNNMNKERSEREKGLAGKDQTHKDNDDNEKDSYHNYDYANQNSNNDTSCSYGINIENISKSKFKKELIKYENILLDTYSIDIDINNYKFKSRPQDKWKKSFDNFSDKFHNTNNLVKYNKIEPQIKLIKEIKQIKYFEKNFVPKIYPKLEFLIFIDREHLVQTHIYSQELNSLVWSEELTDNSHRGYNLLGGDGNLFKITENIYNPNPKYKMILNSKEFDIMIEKIKKYTIISIDVEHHNIDSYRGFICLIQISTLEDDYIIDPFNMFNYINKLNIVTTDPKILKIMHGASNDVIWLQRDFGVFIVNMFDTREAAKLLSLNEQSLSSLLKKYFDIKLNKVYQLSDWSKRPLNEEMLNYACYDSHFLIPLYVCLKNDILKKSNPKIRMIQVMRNSRDICLKQYRDRGVELCQKFRSICKRNKIQKGNLDFVSYNFLLNLLAFRNFAARKFDTSENLIIKDYQISIIIKSLKSGSYFQFVNTMNTYLQSIKFEISNLIKIKNSIEMIYKKLNQVDLILIRPRSIQFIMNCLNEDNLDKKHRKCIDNTLKVYNKFVASGLFNNISPIQFDMNEIHRAESEVEKSTNEKRSLAEEGNIIREFRKKKINI